MAQMGPEALSRLQEVIRQLRTMPQVREKRPGTYDLLGQVYVQFHEADGKLYGDLRKPSGTGFDRLSVETAPEQRKFVDEAKRRAAKITDE